MKHHTLTLTLLCLISLFLNIGCKPEKHTASSKRVTTRNDNRNTHGHAQRLEVPRLNPDNLFNCYTTTHQGKETVTFSIEYDPTRRHSKWVAYSIDNSTAQKDWSRKNWENGDPFKPDPNLPKQVRISHDDHRKDKYNRGHLCASEDRVYNKEANAHTFYYSNISPQLEGFNKQGPWHDLEKQIRIWGGCDKGDAAISDTLYVVKGGTIRDGEYYDSRGQHGNIVNAYEKMNGIVVPAHYFVAIVSRKGDSFTGIAFYLDHKEYANDTSIIDFAVSINRLEELTGIDFFCNLLDKIEEITESQCDFAQWGLSNSK